MSIKLEKYLAKIAVKEALYLPINTKFKVSELFPRASWIVLSQEEMDFARVGGIFYDELKEQKLLNKYIKELPNEYDGATVYQRIGKTVTEALKEAP